MISETERHYFQTQIEYNRRNIEHYQERITAAEAEIAQWTAMLAEPEGT